MTTTYERHESMTITIGLAHNNVETDENGIGETPAKIIYVRSKNRADLAGALDSFSKCHEDIWLYGLYPPAIAHTVTVGYRPGREGGQDKVVELIKGLVRNFNIPPKKLSEDIVAPSPFGAGYTRT